jgi:diguanylate cyclase (GGDEF)-like protein/PAS domain S-box-containing protein
MNSTLNQWISSKKIEYITLNAGCKIVEHSNQIDLFSDSTEQVINGKDSRQYFPEIVGLEEVMKDIVQAKISHFVLKNVCIESEQTSILYRNIHAFKNSPEETDLAGDILVVFEESTQQSLEEYRLSQIIKVHDFTVSYFTQGINLEYLEPIFNSLADLFIVTNEAGNIEFLNSATIDALGYSKHELLNQPISRIFQGSQLIFPINLIQLNNTSQLLKNIDINCQTKQGDLIPVSFSCSPLHDSSYPQQKLIWIGRDITDQKQFDRQLRQQVEQTRFLGNITQRIRQSLSLEIILKTTITEIQPLLQIDKVLFYQFYTDKTQQLQAEIIASNVANHFHPAELEELLTQHLLSSLSQGEVYYLPDINQVKLDSELKYRLHRLNILALLIIPILTHTDTDSNLWGTLIITYHTPNPPNWDREKVNLLKRLASQLTIAIQQSQLYEELQQKNQELEQLSVTDSLTQIANRYDFNQTLEKEWRRLGREATYLSIILGDIDYFKQYNDTYGYPAGDACLQLIASALKDTIKRPADKVARYGSDEFALILPNTDPAGALLVAKSILNRIKALQIPHSHSTVAEYVTISLGVASLLPTQLLTSESLIQMADRALLTAKQHGRDRIFALTEDGMIN